MAYPDSVLVLMKRPLRVSRPIQICFPDGRKYKSFEGLQLVFWPLDVRLTVNFNERL